MLPPRKWQSGNVWTKIGNAREQKAHIKTENKEWNTQGKFIPEFLSEMEWRLGITGNFANFPAVIISSEYKCLAALHLTGKLAS